MQSQKSRVNLENAKPQVRDTDIAVYEVLSCLSKSMTQEEILKKHPELETEDIAICLSFAAEREMQLAIIFDKNLALYTIAGVIFSWLSAIAIHYWIVISYAQEGRTFLEILGLPSIWITMMWMTYFGRGLGMIFYPDNDKVSEDLKRYTSDIVALSMALTISLFFVIFSVYTTYKAYF